MCPLWNRWDGLSRRFWLNPSRFIGDGELVWKRVRSTRPTFREETSKEPGDETRKRRPGIDRERERETNAGEREKDSETKWKSPGKNQARASYLRAYVGMYTHRWDYYAITHLAVSTCASLRRDERPRPRFSLRAIYALNG